MRKFLLSLMLVCIVGIGVSPAKATPKPEIETISVKPVELDKKVIKPKTVTHRTIKQKAVTKPVSKPQPRTYSSPTNVGQIVHNAAIRHGLDPTRFQRFIGCESGWNPNSVNYNYYDNGHPSGLAQHITGYWPARAAQYGYPGASVFNAEANANVTAAMLAAGQGHLWECVY